MTTIAGCAAYARERLPRFEADLLVSHALGVPRSHLYAFDERSVETAAAARVTGVVARRAGGEPVAYITGERGFWGLDLEVTPDVLIPRPDTEVLVAAALPLIGECARVLDLGTGSGAVALAIAAERPKAFVMATDIDAASIALCRRNAAQLGLAIETRVADRFEGLVGRFDVIVSNPPYVAEQDACLNEGDLRFEPRRALVGGPDLGLDFLAGLVADVHAHLFPDGWFCVEHGSDQEESLAGLFTEHAFRDIRCYHDLEDRPRVTVGRLAQTRS